MLFRSKNLEKLGEYTYTYDFDEFGKDVLEELGKVIIAKPNTFRTTGRRQEAMATTTNLRAAREAVAARPEPPSPAAPLVASRSEANTIASFDAQRAGPSFLSFVKVS